MVKVNLGQQIEFVRVLVANDSYDGTIVEISDVYTGSDLDGKPQEKLCIFVETDSGIKLPKFVSAIISAAGEYNSKRNNSALYDLLKASGNLKQFVDASVDFIGADRTEEQSNTLFAELLRQLFIGKRVKVTTKTATPKGDGEKYSRIGEIIRFLDDAPIEEEKVALGATTTTV